MKAKRVQQDIQSLNVYSKKTEETRSPGVQLSVDNRLEEMLKGDIE